MELKGKDLAAASGKMHALSPLAVLERGYSIAFKDGEVVRDAGSLKKGDLLRTRFARGFTASRVEDIAE